MFEVLRTWEKNSPIHRIHDQLKKLFDQAEIEERLEEEKRELEEIRRAQFSKSMKTVSRYRYDLLVEKLEKHREQRLKLLMEFKLVKPNFGKQHYRINMTPKELELMKRIIQQEL